jgi:hypothetical protein
MALSLARYAHLTKQFSNYTNPLLALLAIVGIGNVLRMITKLGMIQHKKSTTD